MLGIYAVLAGVFVIAERVFPRARQPLLRRGLRADALYVPLHIGIGVAGRWWLGAALTRLGEALLPPTLVGVVSDRTLGVQLVALIAATECSFYVIHRAKHRFLWWWKLHETHHSAVELDWLTSARFHPLERVVDRGLFLLPLLVLGASDSAIFAWAVFDAACGMFAHSNLRVRLGPLIYLINGPEMHLWHHSPEHAHRHNFGNNLSVLDWLLGTAILPRELPRRFGVDDPAYPQENLIAQIAYPFRHSARRADAPTPRGGLV